MCLVSFQWSILTYKTRWNSAGFWFIARLIGLEPNRAAYVFWFFGDGMVFAGCDVG